MIFRRWLISATFVLSKISFTTTWLYCLAKLRNALPLLPPPRESLCIGHYSLNTFLEAEIQKSSLGSWSGDERIAFLCHLKSLHVMAPFTWNFQNKGIHRDSEDKEWEWGVTASGCGFLFEMTTMFWN